VRIKTRKRPVLRAFKCGLCGKWRPWSKGCADGLGDVCDGCWSEVVDVSVKDLVGCLAPVIYALGQEAEAATGATEAKATAAEAVPFGPESCEEWT
jgi:hypothetical protein